MSFCIPAGRLGNQVFRALAMNFLATKHNLAIMYSSHADMTALGIPLFSGTTIHPTIQSVTDKNFHELLNADKLETNLVANDYFQSPSISLLSYEYLRSPEVQKSIRLSNPYRERYGHNKDVCLHLRLTDVASATPGFKYFEKVLDSLEGQYDALYLFTDEPQHEIIRKLCEKYSKAQLTPLPPIETLQFASTCRYLILSHGSFSALMGYLAFESDVYYATYEPGKIWYGDLFSIPSWNKISLN